MPAKDTYQQWLNDGEAESMLATIQSLSMQGYPLESIAGEIGVSARTLKRMKEKYASVRSALKNGRRSVVALLQRRLLDKVADGDTTAIIYALKVYGGDFFNNDRLKLKAEVSGADGGSVNVAVVPQIYLPQKEEPEDGE